MRSARRISGGSGSRPSSKKSAARCPAPAIQLHDAERLPSVRGFSTQADRLIASETAAFAAAPRHLLDRQAALEYGPSPAAPAAGRFLELVRRDSAAVIDERLAIEAIVIGRGHRAVEGNRSRPCPLARRRNTSSGSILVASMIGEMAFEE